MASDVGNYNVGTNMNFFENDQAIVIVSLVLILYAGIVASRLPYSVLKLFENWIVQIVLFYLIFYLSTKNMSLALVATIAVVVTIMEASNTKSIKKRVSMAMRPERFCGSNVNSNYDSYRDDGYVFDDDNNMVYRSEEPEFRNIAMKNDKPMSYKLLGPSGPVELPANARDLSKRSHHMGMDDDNLGGVMPEHIVDHDNAHAGMEHVVPGGAVTSKGGPLMNHINRDSDTDDSSSESESIGSRIKHRLSAMKGQIGGEIKNLVNFVRQQNNVTGIEQTSMENNGSMLSETESADSEHAPPVSSEHPPAESADEMVRSSVEQVAAEMEQETGNKMSSARQERVVGEVKERVAEMANQGETINGYNVISVCREVYRKSA